MSTAVWVHGGGWMQGSKNEMHHKPAAFAAKGFVFVPVNYRFIPDVIMDTIVRDVAKAVGWVHANISRHGGDRNRIFVMGFSAGAQLAALDLAGVPAQLFGAEGTDHVKLDRDLGAAGDAATKALFEFTERLLGERRR